MKKIVIISVIVIAILAVVFFIVKKEAVKKKERSKLSGYTREELKRKLQLAWKDRYFETQDEWLRTSPDSKEWRDSIEASALEAEEDADKHYLQAVQFSWATDQPKAWDNPWSRGWIEHVYLESQGIEPTVEVKQLLKEI